MLLAILAVILILELGAKLPVITIDILILKDRPIMTPLAYLYNQRIKGTRVDTIELYSSMVDS